MQQHSPSRIGRDPDFVETVGLGNLRVISANGLKMPEITYDPANPDAPEFSPDEWTHCRWRTTSRSKTRMLAGKYENAEQLEKAYLELQSKLGRS